MFFSCKNENSNVLLGSWKLKNVVDYTGENGSDKMTFFEDGKATAEVFLNNKLVTKIESKYVFDQQKKTLSIITGNFSVVYKVVKLNENELYLEDLKTHAVIRNVRY